MASTATIFETIFPKKYLYDGIQNIQFSDTDPIVYMSNISDRVYTDVKFTAYGTYQIYAEIEFNKNRIVNLKSGIIYPGSIQHPTNPKAQRIINNPTPQYYLIDEITLLPEHGLIQPVFIQNATKLTRKINVKNIKICGPAPIEFAYTEWWDKELKTGKRPFQHADNMYSNSKFNNITNPRHMYKEMIILKWHAHTYATAINGPSCYMGIDFAAGNIVFSVWNANKDGKETPNKMIETGATSTSTGFGHEGSGCNFTLPYNKAFPNIKLQINHKYGFYIRYDETDGNTIYSGYFINLGPVDAPLENPEWIFIGKVLHYTTYVIESRIGGFLENFMTANGHLYQRSVAMGNSWMSIDGVNWLPSTHEEAVLFDLNNQQASTHNPANNLEGFIKYSIGGRLGTVDEGLTKHGNLRAYDVYRNCPVENVPKHLIYGKLP